MSVLLIMNALWTPSGRTRSPIEGPTPLTDNRWICSVSRAPVGVTALTLVPMNL